ncbi:MAG: hypothetical protein ABEI76_06010 [Halobacteriales archaeon]
MDEGDEDVDRPSTSEAAASEHDPSTDRLETELEELRSEFEDFESRLDDRIVHRQEIESELKRYVRQRLRRGHARGWGPYLVLLYGTLMTIGAFYFLSGGWAILAMVVVWLSTLGLYALMVLVGLGLSLLGLPRKGIDRLRQFRD